MIKNKKQHVFYLCLGLVLWFWAPVFLRARLGTKVKLRARKVGYLKGNLSTPVISGLTICNSCPKGNSSVAF